VKKFIEADLQQIVDNHKKLVEENPSSQSLSDTYQLANRLLQLMTTHETESKEFKDLVQYLDDEWRNRNVVWMNLREIVHQWLKFDKKSQ